MRWVAEATSIESQLEVIRDPEGWAEPQITLTVHFTSFHLPNKTLLSAADKCGIYQFVFPFLYSPSGRDLADKGKDKEEK